jgi:transposase
MTVEEHYARLLQLPPPWEVTKVEESLIEQRVTVWLRWPDGVKARCPECGQEASVYDRLAERTWRHLSVMQYRLELRCATPRCRCEQHGVKAVRVPCGRTNGVEPMGSGRVLWFFEPYLS